MKTAKSTTYNTSSKKTLSKTSEEIKPDFPLSERDEVKRAEKRLNEALKKHNL